MFSLSFCSNVLSVWLNNPPPFSLSSIGNWQASIVTSFVHLAFFFWCAFVLRILSSTFSTPSTELYAIHLFFFVVHCTVVCVPLLLDSLSLTRPLSLYLCLSLPLFFIFIVVLLSLLRRRFPLSLFSSLLLFSSQQSTILIFTHEPASPPILYVCVLGSSLLQCCPFLSFIRINHSITQILHL